LGTPNVASLLATLSGASAGTGSTTAKPVVTSATINGSVGSALSFTVSISGDSNPITYSMVGAPSGMLIGGTGSVTWPTPVAGTYSVSVTAKDSKTGLSGTGTYTVIIAAPAAPVVASANISGKVGTALSYSVAVADIDPITYSITNAPSGMTISSTGTVTWAKPVASTSAVTVTAKDTKTGLSGHGVLTVTITAAGTATGPTITAPAMNGVAGHQLTGTIVISDPGVSSLSVSISGAPMGMMFSVTGLTLTASWASPIQGSYSLKVLVNDSAGRSIQTTIPITIAAN
jgi:hypothetical protein